MISLDLAHSSLSDPGPGVGKCLATLLTVSAVLLLSQSILVAELTLVSESMTAGGCLRCVRDQCQVSGADVTESPSLRSPLAGQSPSLSPLSRVSIPRYRSPLPAGHQRPPVTGAAEITSALLRCPHLTTDSALTGAHWWHHLSSGLTVSDGQETLLQTINTSLSINL